MLEGAENKRHIVIQCEVSCGYVLHGKQSVCNGNSRHLNSSPASASSSSSEVFRSESLQSSSDESDGKDIVDDEAIEITEEVAQAEDNSLSVEEVDSSYDDNA